MDVNWCKLGEGNKLYFILFYSFLMEGMQSVTWLQASVVDPDPHRSAVIWLSWIRIIIPDPQHWINYTGTYILAVLRIHFHRIRIQASWWMWIRNTAHWSHRVYRKSLQPQGKIQTKCYRILSRSTGSSKKGRNTVDICSISSELKINYCQQS
jgi:hypothetical protein